MILAIITWLAVALNLALCVHNYRRARAWGRLNAMLLELCLGALIHAVALHMFRAHPLAERVKIVAAVGSDHDDA